jgi:hypothetical protein
MRDGIIGRENIKTTSHYSTYLNYENVEKEMRE